MVVSRDEEFARLADPFRRELLVYCYRMVGSVDEAEDLVQETYLRAWRFYAEFEGRSSLRTWLYRIATNSCLTALEHRGRRPLPSGLGAASEDPAVIVAGIGIGMIFATTASAATAAVPLHDTGVAAGTNTALRELGGVFGIAILAAVFAHNGSYASPAAFIDGFKPALWVAAVVPLVGLVAAFLAPSKSAAETERTTCTATHDALLTGQPE